MASTRRSAAVVPAIGTSGESAIRNGSPPVWYSVVVMSEGSIPAY